MHVCMQTSIHKQAHPYMYTWASKWLNVNTQAYDISYSTSLNKLLFIHAWHEQWTQTRIYINIDKCTLPFIRTQINICVPVRMRKFIIVTQAFRAPLKSSWGNASAHVNWNAYLPLSISLCLQHNVGVYNVCNVVVNVRQAFRAPLLKKIRGNASAHVSWNEYLPLSLFLSLCL